MASAPSTSASDTRTGQETRRLSSEDRRKQLLENAVKLFSKHGFSGTRTKDIAAASGVSEGVLFRHFATKEDLYQAILDSYEAGASGNWVKEIKEPASRNDDEAFVRSLVHQIFHSFREEPDFHRLMAYARLEGHSLVDIFHERMGLPTFGFVRSYIEQRQADGAFRQGDPALLAMFLFSPALQYAINQFIFGHCAKPIQFSTEQAAEEIVQMTLAGLRAAPQRDSGLSEAAFTGGSSGSTETGKPRQEKAP